MNYFKSFSNLHEIAVENKLYKEIALNRTIIYAATLCYILDYLKENKKNEIRYEKIVEILKLVENKYKK